MTHMAQQALTLGKLAEGNSTGLDKPAMWIQRSSSARSLGSSLEAGALETSTPSLISHRRLVVYTGMYESGSKDMECL